MAHIARRAHEELQELRDKRELSIGECKVALPDDDFALPVLRQLKDLYRAEQEGAGNEDAKEFLDAITADSLSGRASISSTTSRASPVTSTA